MKRFIGLLMCLLLIAGCLSVSQTDEGEHEEVTIIDTKKIEYLTDEQLSLLYSCKQDIRKKDDSIVELSQSDAWLLMQLACAETGDKGVEAQYLTMMVVINRMRDKRFPNTISEIIYEDNQFAVVGEKLKKTEPNIESHLALAKLEQGIDESEGAIFFEASTNSDESWHKQNKIFLYEKYGQRYYK